MKYLTLQRYFTTLVDSHESLGFASILDIPSKSGERPVFEAEYNADETTLLDRLRGGEYWLTYGVAGTEPLCDCWNTYPVFKRSFVDMLEPRILAQIQLLDTTVHTDDGRIVRNVSLATPIRSIDCFVESVPLSGGQYHLLQSIEDVPNELDDIAVGYRIDSAQCGGSDIFYVANSPKRFVVISEWFYEWMLRYVPLKGFFVPRYLIT